MNALSPHDFAKDSILDLGHNECRWPIGKLPPFRFCASPTKTGRSYCHHHQMASYTSPVRPTQTMGGRVAGSFVNAIAPLPEPRKPRGDVKLLKRKPRKTDITPEDLMPRTKQVAAIAPVEIQEEVGEEAHEVFSPFRIEFYMNQRRPVHRLDWNCYSWPIRIPNESELADMVLSSMVPPKTPIQDIIAAAAKEYGVPVGEILGPRRTNNIVRVRQIAMWVARYARPDRSLPEIGRRFGGKDHTTVLHAVRKIDGWIKDGRVTIPDSLLSLTKPVGEG